jgi:hypothetical protein
MAIIEIDDLNFQYYGKKQYALNGAIITPILVAAYSAAVKGRARRA